MPLVCYFPGLIPACIKYINIQYMQLQCKTIPTEELEDMRIV